jgi:hypothetical protein
VGGYGYLYYPLANKITSAGLDEVESKTNLETPELRYEGRGGGGRRRRNEKK